MFHQNITIITACASYNHHLLINLHHFEHNSYQPTNPALVMKVPQIVALSATLILQAHACVRIRVDRYTDGSFYTIQDIKLYDNDEPVKTNPYPINFARSGEENDISVGDYRAELQYKDGKPHPYGGWIRYPNGCKSATPLSMLTRVTNSVLR